MENRKSKKELEELESLNPGRHKGSQKDKHPNQYGQKNEKFGIGNDSENASNNKDDEEE